MKRFNILITGKIPRIAVNKIKEECNVEINDESKIMSYDEIKEKIKNKNGILCMLTDKIDKGIINAGLPTLKVISNYAVGHDNIDIPEASNNGIIVTNTPDVLTDATAEITWALLFAVARRIIEGDKVIRSNRFKGWQPDLLLGTQITGKTLGIVGSGRIGQSVGIKSMGFGMRVLYTARKPKYSFEKDINAEFVDLETLLKLSDFITVHVPLSSETRHMFTEKEFKLMQSTSIFINTSRGAVVKEDDLVKALKNGWIAGAGLDVYEYEPKVHQELLELNNTVLLPHLGSATHETREKMALMAVENLLYALKGKIPPNIVNKDALDIA